MLFVIVCSNFAFSIPHRGPMQVGTEGPGECYGKAVSSDLGRRRVKFQRTAVEAGRGFVVRVALGPVSGQAWV